MTKILKEFRYLQTRVVGDINEDITNIRQTVLFYVLCRRIQASCSKTTHDSGTLIDHVYVSNSLQVDSDVSDCYYSDHDHVLCAFNI